MKSKNHINLFFLELLFSIFFFVVVSTICLQVFAKAHYLNVKTSSTTHALEIVQNEIELFYFDINNGKQIHFEDTVVFYSSDFNKLSLDINAEYSLIKNYTFDGDIVHMNISFIRISDSLVLFSKDIEAF